MEKKKYNLGSGKSECIQIPMQVQLSDDNEFIGNLLGSANTDLSPQDSPQSSSDSELDCGAAQPSRNVLKWFKCLPNVFKTF